MGLVAQRLHRIPKGKPQLITWKSLYEQFGHGYVRLRAFRAEFLRVLTLVHTHYRAAKVDATEEGLLLSHSQPPIPSRLVLVHKPLG